VGAEPWQQAGASELDGCADALFSVAKLEPASVLVFKESARKIAVKTKVEKNSKKTSR
jgi:hypothetical protein